MALGVLLVAGWPWATRAQSGINASETAVRLGLSGGYASYEENVRPQDTEAGALFGIEAGVSSLTPTGFARYGWPDLYADVSDDFSGSFLHYQGNLQNGAQTPYDASDNGYYNTAIVRLGLGRPILGNAELIPYAAGGYQIWQRNIGGAGGYGEFYKTGMLGGGIKLDVLASPLLVVSASAEGYAVIGGGVDVPAQNFTGSFGTGAAERVSLDADYRLGDAWHAFAGLGLTHYGYTGSKPDAAGAYEPLSTTLQINSMFGLAYGF